MIEAVERAGDDATDPAEALARAASRLYDEVAAGAGDRGAALPLLAADALLTHAFEARASSDPAGLSAFAARWSIPARTDSSSTPS